MVLCGDPAHCSNFALLARGRSRPLFSAGNAISLLRNQNGSHEPAALAPIVARRISKRAYRLMVLSIIRAISLGLVMSATTRNLPGSPLARSRNLSKTQGVVLHHFAETARVEHLLSIPMLASIFLVTGLDGRTPNRVGRFCSDRMKARSRADGGL